MTSCRNTYGGYGSYLRSRGYDQEICNVVRQIEKGIIKAGAINIINGGPSPTNSIPPSGGVAANIRFDNTSGNIIYNPSSKKYKTDIKDTPLTDANKLLDIKARNYFYKSNLDAPQTGFIAEELNEVDYLKRFVVYNSEGLPDAVSYDQIVAPLLEIVRDNKNRITNLEAQLQSALDRITALENK